MLVLALGLVLPALGGLGVPVHVPVSAVAAQGFLGDSRHIIVGIGHLGDGVVVPALEAVVSAPGTLLVAVATLVEFESETLFEALRVLCDFGGVLFPHVGEVPDVLGILVDGDDLVGVSIDENPVFVDGDILDVGDGSTGVFADAVASVADVGVAVTSLGSDRLLLVVGKPAGFLDTTDGVNNDVVGGLVLDDVDHDQSFLCIFVSWALFYMLLSVLAMASYGKRWFLWFWCCELLICVIEWNGVMNVWIF